MNIVVARRWMKEGRVTRSTRRAWCSAAKLERGKQKGKCPYFSPIGVNDNMPVFARSSQRRVFVICDANLQINANQRIANIFFRFDYLW